MSLETKRRSIKAKFFKGLSDDSRLLILETLQASEKTVTEIVQVTNLTQPNVSNHLACLKRCGLVSSEQNGRSVTYKLHLTEIVTLLAIADTIMSNCEAQVDQCDSMTEDKRT
ncbi:MAG: metalloregulator ArsR/SmtB family transcription factor [Candidatus Obscuribacterales bacterium]|nr:metalloregulator ArsR/SmtB family transcription factor [Candidatus Obscuribacterales bacterium]